MRTWEVNIIYRGVNRYLVRADTEELAYEEALVRYTDGDNGDPTGSEWEDIEKHTVVPVNEGVPVK